MAGPPCGSIYHVHTIFLPSPQTVFNFYFYVHEKKEGKKKASTYPSPKQVPTQKHNCPFNKQVFLEFLSSNEITWFSCSKHFFQLFFSLVGKTRLLEKLKLSLKFSHAGYKSWVDPA